MKKEKDTARRDFLKLTMLSLAATAAGAAAPAAEAREAEEGAAGYRETEHVRTYYRLARF